MVILDYSPPEKPDNRGMFRLWARLSLEIAIAYLVAIYSATLISHLFGFGFGLDEDSLRYRVCFVPATLGMVLGLGSMIFQREVTYTGSCGVLGNILWIILIPGLVRG
jgi:hypothetical protein